MNNPFKQRPAAGGSFLPEEYVAHRGEVRANLICVGLFLVVMVAVTGAFLVTTRQWNSIRTQKQSINIAYQQEAQKIEQLKKLEDQRSGMLEKAEITTALLEKIPRSVLMAQLFTPMPGGVTVLGLELKSKRLDPPAPPPPDPKDAKAKKKPAVKTLSGKAGADKGAAPGKPGAEEKPRVAAPKFEHTLTITGVAAVNNDIADYLTALKNSPILGKVELQYIQQTTIDKVDLRKFEIQAMLREDADVRRIAETRQAGVESAKASEEGR